MMMVKGNSQITRKPMWLFEQIYHRDEYIRENNFPLYGILLFLHGFIIDFANSGCFRWSTSDLLGSMYIYHFPVETRLLRSFLIYYAEICLST